MIDEPTATPPGAIGEAAPAASALPARTTPTWEMELLLSGATVFGLLQLPDKLDRFFIGWIGRSGEVLASFVLPLAVYLQFAVFVLALTFVAHLCLRGYWVALVGVHSVYPDGMRRDTGRFGPHYLEVMRRRERSAPDLIEAADNRATLVFAVGVGLALAMLVPMVLALLGIVAIVAGGALGLDVGWIRTVFIALFASVLLPAVLAAAWDRRRGADVALDSATGRRLQRVFDAYTKLGLLRGGNSLVNVFVSRIGGRRGAAVVGLVVSLAMMAVGMRLVASGQDWFAGDPGGLPVDAPSTPDNLHAAFYARLRGDVPTLAPMPYINGPVVEGPYLELFIPYRPRRYDGLVRVRCAGARTAPARLACVAGLVGVRLDGVALALAPVAARDPDSGQRGLLAMIPTATLAPGRHELAIQPPRRPGDAEAPLPYRIPFWK